MVLKHVMIGCSVHFVRHFATTYLILHRSCYHPCGFAEQRESGVRQASSRIVQVIKYIVIIILSLITKVKRIFPNCKDRLKALEHLCLHPYFLSCFILVTRYGENDDPIKKTPILIFDAFL